MTASRKEGIEMRAHIHVRGRVQGIFFRSNCELVANSLGLKGWVRNLPDGRVEIMVEGGEREVNELMEWCHEGPRHAKVKEVDVEWLEAVGEFSSFRVLYW